MSEDSFRAHMRALDTGLAIGRQIAGQFLLGVTTSPDFSREQLAEIGKQWIAEATAELERLEHQRVASPVDYYCGRGGVCAKLDGHGGPCSA